MYGYFRFLIRAFLILLIFPATLFPMGSKIQKIPVKPYPSVSIPDGEFLHYGNYTRGEKYSDTYMVIRKVTNENNEVFYRIFKNDIRISSGKKLPERYSDWKSSFLIDPRLGSVIEAVENTGFEAEDNNNRNGFNYVYRFYPEKGYADFILKTKKDNVTNESKYRVKVDPAFPAWDNLSLTYALCFLDFSRGGILYMINPSALKEPMPFSFKFISRETLQTKAGIFKTARVKVVVADVFLARLMGSVLEGSSMWIEDSDRRYLIKGMLAGYISVLEDLSNVNMR